MANLDAKVIFTYEGIKLPENVYRLVKYSFKKGCLNAYRLCVYSIFNP